MEDYGYIEENRSSTNPKEIPARITAVHKQRYEMVCEMGEGLAVLKAGVYYNGTAVEFPAVGDFVLLEYNPLGESQIVQTLPRKSFFSRRNPTPGMGEQAIAANFDYVWIVSSMNKDYSSKRLARYMAMAWQSGAEPIVILTKADVCQDRDAFIIEAEAAAIGARIITASVVTGEGREELQALLSPGKTVVLLGSSGVGKSSLINHLSGTEVMKTGEIREDDSRGRHTTTHRQLIRLTNGAMVIDTPGMRELGVWDAKEGIGEAYSDIEALMQSCKFSDCTHGNEPGCAVQRALNDGELSRDRWAYYNKLMDENRYSEDRKAYVQAKTEKFKSINKQMRKERKLGVKIR